jgi:hypothetical protein
VVITNLRSDLLDFINLAKFTANSIKWFSSQGQDQNVIANFQHYTDEKLTPHFNQDFSEVTFSFERGNEEQEDNIKISKGEESNFIWSVFYTLVLIEMRC